MDSCFKTRKADIEITYKRVTGLNLPIHIFLPDGDIHKARTVLFIHGGGWTDAIQDNTEWDGGWMANNAKFFAERGFVAVAISYRSLLVSSDLNVEDILKDCIDAILYIKYHLKFMEFNNITYVGESAGGYIATMLGLSQNDVVRPEFAVAINPVLDSIEDKWNYGFKNCRNIYKLIPKNIVDKKCSRFLFIHGTEDETVNIEDTRNMHKTLLKSGHSSELIEVPSGKHGFALYDYINSDINVTNIMNDIIDFISV